MNKNKDKNDETPSQTSSYYEQSDSNESNILKQEIIFEHHESSKLSD